MGKALVIVESPAKARTISGLLGPDFIVESSIGHIRDLPRGADEVPAAYKGENWARLGVDVDNGFKPLYVVSASKKSVVANLKRLLKDADELYLATDEDREGESIAWHLFEVLSPTVPVKRMVFHEITPEAITRAVEEWRELDRRLVDAQEARRILDRLYGYEVSPVLWRKVMPRLSAGRVQSVATRMVVERERARMRFHSATWWGIEGTFSHTQADEAPPPFGATLVSLGGTAVATGKDFNEDGEQTSKGQVRVLAEDEATSVASSLAGQSFTVSAVTERPFRRSPAAPFMTSTLQQEAGRKLRFSAQRAMQVAQRLYEQGYITYMRTDSTTLSEQALTAARSQAREMYGDAYVPDTPRRYERKVKNAQEAHEAIRPAGETFRTPEQAARSLTGDELHLYDLIWKRTVASQMNDATGTSAQIRLVSEVPAGGPGNIAAGEVAEFSASGRVIAFPGFLRAYVEGQDDPDAELADREVVLPALVVGDVVEGTAFEPGSHTTQPPARYTEASLVKAMEELGVGRPSTYASVIATILDRGYVWKKGTALVPSFTAFAVVGLLERYFGELVDYGFTASMEDDLDSIASGREESLPWLSRFYFGTASPGVTLPGGNDGATLGLKASVAAHLGDIDAREINSILIGAGADGVPIVARVGRYGPYLQRGDDRASLPDDMAPDELTVARSEELAGRAHQRPCPRRRPRDGSRRLRQGRPLRALRPARRSGRGFWVSLGQATHLVPLLHHGPGHAHLRAGSRAAQDPAHRRDRPRDRRGGGRPQRQVRPLPEEGDRHPQPHQRGPDLQRDVARGPGALRPAQATPRPHGGGSATRTGGRPGVGTACRGQRRTLRAVCDRRDDERLSAQGRRRRVDHHRTGVRAPGRTAGRRAPPHARRRAGRRRPPRRPEAPRRRRPRRRRPGPRRPVAPRRPPRRQPGRRRRLWHRGPQRTRYFSNRSDVAPRGRLLALEGIDGCGKSTQARALAGALGARLTHEPGATVLGAELRRLLLAPDSPSVSLRAEALLMAADRAEHLALVVEPALAAGEWVVSDRFSGSTLAYQGYGRGLETAELGQLIAYATSGLSADLSILVDVPVAVAAARLGAAAPDRLERLGPAFAQRVRDGFLSLAADDPAHWAVVDGTTDPAALATRILAIVYERLGRPSPLEGTP